MILAKLGASVLVNMSAGNDVLIYGYGDISAGNGFLD